MSRRTLLRRLIGIPVMAAIAVGVASSPAYAASGPQQEAAAFAAAFKGTTAKVTATVLDDTGATLAGVNPATAQPPASTEKIATIGAALKVFGPTHRFTTVVQGFRPLPVHRTWKGLQQTSYGPVVVVGGGDPSLRAAGLTTLLTPIARSGVKTIRGGLWLDVSLLDSVRTAPGWKPEWLGTEVGPLSAFMYEQNLSRTDSAYLQDPDSGNLSILSSWLSSHGITVYGGLHVGRPAGVLRTVASVSSQPLSVLGTTTLQDSVNTWAEMLLKDVGASDGNGSTSHGLAVVRSIVAAAGGDLGVAYDGSGLSQLDSKSATQELSTAYGLGTSTIGSSLLAELPVSCTSGTLKNRLCNLPGRVHAKTGTVDGVCALTGYVVDSSGRRMWFSVQVQGGAGQASRQALIDRSITSLAG